MLVRFLSKSFLLFNVINVSDYEKKLFYKDSTDLLDKLITWTLLRIIYTLATYCIYAESVIAKVIRIQYLLPFLVTLLSQKSKLNDQSLII